MPKDLFLTLLSGGPPAAARFVPAALVALVLGACGAAEGEPGGASADAPGDTEPAGPVAERDSAELPVDWELFRDKVTWAWENGVDTLPVGESMARLGETFVGTEYKPHTLEVPGPERLVINLQAMDCVTFVENVLALTHFVKNAPPTVMEQEHVYRSYFRGLLKVIRYRESDVDDYVSRLHYFSEWMSNNEAEGRVRLVAREMGGVADGEPIDFMSTHTDAYRQLAEDPSNVERIREIESRLSAEPRYYLPEDRIADAHGQLRNGDIIAATSTVPGLDVAHTGIVVIRDGVPHLMHAPLVGDSVQISERSLAQRILEIEGQDGIMVARPLEPRK